MKRSTPMRRSTFMRHPPRPEKAIAYTPRPREPAKPVAAVSQARASVRVPKTPDRREQAIREFARGRECTVRLVGVCTFDPEKSIWSHAPLQAAGKGRGIKSIDLCGAIACTACDAVVDGQAPLPAGATRDSVLLDWFMGHMRSLVQLRQEGIV